MKVLFDVNIFLDLALRPGLYPASVALYQKLEEQHHTVCLASCAYTTVYYLLSKTVGAAGALEFLTLLELRGVEVLTFSLHDIHLARKLRFRDHEDACLAASALSSSCNIIVTRNLSDFKFSPVQAQSPDKLLNTL